MDIDTARWIKIGDSRDPVRYKYRRGTRAYFIFHIGRTEKFRSGVYSSRLANLLLQRGGVSKYVSDTLYILPSNADFLCNSDSDQTDYIVETNKM